jgi:hypothetical protein
MRKRDNKRQWREFLNKPGTPATGRKYPLLALRACEFSSAVIVHAQTSGTGGFQIVRR